MAHRYKFSIEAKKKESLTDLYRSLKEEFPNVIDRFDLFDISQVKKPFFGSGTPVIKKIVAMWEIEDADAEAIDLIERVIEYIKASGIGDVKIEYDNDQDE